MFTDVFVCVLVGVNLQLFVLVCDFGKQQEQKKRENVGGTEGEGGREKERGREKGDRKVWRGWRIVSVFAALLCRGV